MKAWQVPSECPALSMMGPQQADLLLDGDTVITIHPRRRV
jgi:hypothetical protein